MTNEPYDGPLIFDGPAVVLPERTKAAMGFQPQHQVSMLDMSGVLLMVVITDDEQAHVGGPTTTPEKIELLEIVLAGLRGLE